MAGRCDLTDLLPDQCACPRHRNVQLPANHARDEQPTGPGPWFTAQYPGRCTRCRTEFVAGDQIRADGNGGYLDSRCGEDQADE
jgi:hypothetical protein